VKRRGSVFATERKETGNYWEVDGGGGGVVVEMKFEIMGKAVLAASGLSFGCAPQQGVAVSNADSI